TAHAHGVKVHLAATLFNSSGGSEISTFLGSSAARTAAVDALVNSIAQNHGDGINLDFELVSSAMRDSFSAFLEEARAALDKALPAAELSIAAPPSVGYRGYDFARIGRSARLLLMGYDYHYGGSSN